MLWVIKKELLMNARYKMKTINRYCFPFFLIAPYVLIAQYYGFNVEILKNMIMWIWMCQLLFGVADGIGELCIEGTLVNIIASPIGIVGYLFGKYVYHAIDCIFITLFTLAFAKIFLNLTIDGILLFIVEVIALSLSLFCFSIMFAVMVLKYKKVKELNYFLQQLFGFLSGYTNDIKSYPAGIRFISYLIPLTYSILLNKKQISFKHEFLILLFLSMSYFVLGSVLLKKEINKARSKGNLELW